MKSILTTLLLMASIMAFSQLSVKESLFSKQYYNEGLRIDKSSFEMIIKAEPNAWLLYQKVKPNRFIARSFDGIALGCFAYAYFDKKKTLYYAGGVSALIGYIFDSIADSKLSDAVLITNTSMGFKINL